MKLPHPPRATEAVKPAPKKRAGVRGTLKSVRTFFMKNRVPAAVFAGIILLAGCVFYLTGTNEDKNDLLFEQWLKVQLNDIEMWQATVPLNDPRNADAVRCVWQKRASESDCLQPKVNSYPLSLRLPNGYLLSQGISFPLEERNRWKKTVNALKHFNTGIGLDENWRPCIGEYCRYEVYTGFVPSCAGQSSYCGRAEKFKIGYVIKSRRMNRRIWQPYEVLVSNLDDSGSPELSEFKPENVFGLPMNACKSDLHTPLSRHADGKLLCGISKKNLISVCSGQSRDYSLLYRSGFCLADSCDTFCTRALKTLERSCEPSKQEIINRSPDLYRCNSRSRMLVIKKYKNPFEKPSLVNRANVLSRVLGIDFDFCINKSKCFGAFTREPETPELEAFLEAK